MHNGYWIAFSKTFIDFFPKGRPFSIIEAGVSYQCDLDNGTEKSFHAYSRIWQWSREKVRQFIRQRCVVPEGSPRGCSKTVGVYFTEKSGHLSDTKQGGLKHQVKPELETVCEASNTKQEGFKHLSDTTTVILNKKEEEKEQFHQTKSKLRLMERAFSFQDYEKWIEENGIDEIDEDTKAGITFFLGKYRKYRGEQHPRLKAAQWDEVINKLFVLEDYHEDEDFPLRALKCVIVGYFETQWSEPIDYRLNHFVAGRTKDNLFHQLDKER